MADIFILFSLFDDIFSLGKQAELLDAQICDGLVSKFSIMVDSGGKGLEPRRSRGSFLIHQKVGQLARQMLILSIMIN